MPNFAELYNVGHDGRILKMQTDEYDGDPRGIVWIWEPPFKGETYAMGIDPTVGKTGWNRYNRVKEDKKINNGAIEIIRVGRNGQPDAQVCEFVAPIDPLELGQVANVVGRVYAGTEDDQCQAIIEVTGPGGLTLQQMIELGYINHFKWQYYADSIATETKSWGWHASPRSLRDLWTKASRHICLDRIMTKSPWLAEEYADCRMTDKDYGENPNNKKGHGDRVRAMNLAIWLANKWSLDIERTKEQVTTTKVVDWQLTDASWSDVMEGWGSALDRMS